MRRPIAVWLVKRDARLADNACLVEAKSLGLEVLPLFCFEPSLLVANDTSDMHIHAQWQAVCGLREGLRKQGADIILAYGEVTNKLSKLHSLVPFTHVFSHEEVGNDLTFRRDRLVASWCRDRGIDYREFPQSSVQRGGVNRNKLKRLWDARIVNASPIPMVPIRQSEDLRTIGAITAFPKMEILAPHRMWQAVSEVDAQATLADFLSNRGRWYRGGISSPNTAFSAGSRLSVHLAWGTITNRQVWHAAQERLANLDPADPKTTRWRLSLGAFISRLHWRDHFTQRLESESELEFQSVHPSYREVPYENDECLLEVWRKGCTGYPLVDAVMRCLAATGFVNFRMRAMVVSFACHILHLDWRLIHPPLARIFRDYDPCIHLNQLQMQAGVVGWNAIRVYNPAKQLADWDPNCRFVKRWVPELGTASPEQILAGQVPSGYPPPVVRFAERAKRMTNILYAIRKSTEAKALTLSVYLKHGSRKREGSFQAGKPKRRPPPPTPTLFDDLPPE